MRWHCIVRGKPCRREDVPGQGEYTAVMSADSGSCSTVGQWQMTSSESTIGELEGTILLGVWSWSFGRVSGVYQFWCGRCRSACTAVGYGLVGGVRRYVCVICLAYATGVVNGGKDTTAVASIVYTELVSSTVKDERRLESPARYVIHRLSRSCNWCCVLHAPDSASEATESAWDTTVRENIGLTDETIEAGTAPWDSCCRTEGLEH